MPKQEPIICVVGLGYVGLPLAAAFGRTGWKTYGFDVNVKRIETLGKGEDWTHELTTEDLKKTSVEYSADPSVIGKANVIIVAVPTPVDETNRPDLSLVERASETVGAHIKKGAVVVYESTVYPGVTEDICIPILEKKSGMKNPADFTAGYSPERINPGDREHTIEKIVKVIAGQDDATAQRLEEIYGKIISAGTYRAANIKVAELAKALENTQRDINIALMNEIARLCDRLGIRTKDVLDAAKTKWNFLPFTPGLVGGHCIGVDPYYLVHVAQTLGLHTEVISAGRKMNDTQTTFIAGQIRRAMAERKLNPAETRILVLGLTFKENVPDTRNAKVHDLIRKLSADGCAVAGHDPWLTSDDIAKLGCTAGSLDDAYDVVILAVPHAKYGTMKAQELKKLLKKNGIFYDLRSVHTPDEFTADGFAYLSL